MYRCVEILYSCMYKIYIQFCTKLIYKFTPNIYTDWYSVNILSLYIYIYIIMSVQNLFINGYSLYTFVYKMYVQMYTKSTRS